MRSEARHLDMTHILALEQDVDINVQNDTEYLACLGW